MVDSKTIAIVGANQTQFEHCTKCFQPHVCVDVPAKKANIDQLALDHDLNLALVYTRKTQSDTLDVCDQIRRNPSTVLTPMLLVADYLDVVSIFIAEKAGHAAVIAHPFDSEDLADSVELLEEMIATS